MQLCGTQYVALNPFFSFKTYNIRSKNIPYTKEICNKNWKRCISKTNTDIDKTKTMLYLAPLQLPLGTVS